MVRSKIFVVRRPNHQYRSRVLFAAVTLGLLLFAGTAAAQPVAPELGYKLSRLATPVQAPDFELKDMDDESHTLGNLRGKVVMLNFWATWCPPCRREMPSLEAVYQEFKSEPFVVIAVNEWETPEHVFPYIGQLAVFPSFPILFDRDGKVSQAYAVKGLPTTFLIDQKGMIIYRAVGGRDFNHPEVKKLIRELL